MNGNVSGLPAKVPISEATMLARSSLARPAASSRCAPKNGLKQAKTPIAKPKRDAVRAVGQAPDPMPEVLDRPAPAALRQHRLAHSEQQRGLVASLEDHRAGGRLAPRGPFRYAGRDADALTGGPPR